MPLNEIQAILVKYEDSEKKISSLLKDNVTKRQAREAEDKANTQLQRASSMAEALKRNKELLKDLEAVKSTLRSKAIYSPAEMRWEEICRQYQESPSLPITRWRCNLPVFV